MKTWTTKNDLQKIVDHTNNRINETITSLQRVESYNKSTDNCTWVKKSPIKLNLMHFMDWCILEAHLVWIYIWQIDYFHQTVTLLLVLSCRKIVFCFCEALNDGIFLDYSSGTQSGVSLDIVFRQLIDTQKVLHTYLDWNWITPKFVSWQQKRSIFKSQGFSKSLINSLLICHFFKALK